MTRQTQQLETSMFVRSWGLALKKEAGMFRYLVIAFKRAQKDATVLPICAGV